MEFNPYASPGNEESSENPEPSSDRLEIRHKQFVGQTVSFSLTLSLDSWREKIRQQAEDFINLEVSVENVVSVTEHAMSLGPFTVVVWYRSKS